MDATPGHSLLQKYFRHTPHGMVVLEAVRDKDSGQVCDFRIIDANPAVQRTTGCTAGELRARPYSSVFAGAYRNGLFEILKTATDTQQMHVGELKYEADGISGWFELEVVPDGSLLIVTSHDLTEDRRVQSLADGFFHASGDLHFQTDRHGRIIRANPAAHSTLGLAEGALTGRPVASLIHPDDAEAFDRWTQRLAEGGIERTHAENRIRMVHAEGHAVWIEWGFRFVNEDGVISMTARDITEQIKIDQERQDFEYRLRLFVEHAPAAVAMLDREMRYVLVSRRWVKDFRLEGKQIVGRSHYDLFPTIPPRWKEIHRRCLKGERMSCEEDSFLDETGAPQWLRWEVVPWSQDDGTVAGLVMFTESINQQKQAELERIRHQWILEERNQELNLARQEAEAASRAKSAFLANMSHEIRTPMSAILGYSEILGQQGISDEQRRDAIETIQRNGDHLLALINDVLDLSKIEAGQVRVESKPVEVARLCKDVMQTLRVRAEAHDIRLEMVLEPDVPATVETDPLRVRQVLVNLISNAIKFTSVGGHVKLHVSAPAQARYASELGVPALRFDVIDNGIGISEREAVQLFKPFVQADASTTRRFGGTGLGLALSRQLAQTLGGELRLVASMPNEGSHFRLDIPLTIVSGDAQAPDEQASGSFAHTRRFDGRPRILLVEDGLDNQRLFQFHLQAAGADVTIAANGQLALDMYNHRSSDAQQRFPFDLVLMDMQMPVMDGYQATESLRLLGVDIPILALTAHAMADDRKRCLEVGCDEFLTKPITRDALISACSQWLERSRRAAVA
jgi:PAS domain S-box-containing protein